MEVRDIQPPEIGHRPRACEDRPRAAKRTRKG